MAGAATPTPIFLLSLPRSGSTLVQKVLGAHPSVATVSEPWLLLPSFYALRRTGIEAEYEHSLLVSAFEDLAEKLPDGRASYLAAVRRFALDVYGQLADGAPYFLDKTPRYHLVVDELLETFPDAKFVFLWRNPLAVAASICEHWDRGRWNPYRWNADLRRGLKRLVEGYGESRARSLSVRYEDVVADPEGAFARLFAYLDLPFDPAALDTRLDARLPGRLGDRFGPSKHGDAISTASADSWQSATRGPVRRAWARRYLDWLGPEVLDVMGYDRAALLAGLERGRPSARDAGVLVAGEAATRFRDRRRGLVDTGA